MPKNKAYREPFRQDTSQIAYTGLARGCLNHHPSKAIVRSPDNIKSISTCRIRGFCQNAFEDGHRPQILGKEKHLQQPISVQVCRR